MPDLSDDVAALLVPLPEPVSADTDEAERTAVEQLCEQIVGERVATAERLREALDVHGADPLRRALQEQARIRDAAERAMRMLIAYGREFVTPRPYTQEALAESAHSSITWVRGAYDHVDVEAVASATGSRSTVVQAPVPADEELRRLIGELTARTVKSAQAHVAGVAAALRAQGWTAYPPVPRTPDPKFTRRYLRWERNWPNGTVVSLYQEPAGSLGVYARMDRDDPRWFHEIYGPGEDGEEVTADDIGAALSSYAKRVASYDAALPATRQRERQPT